MTPLLHIRDLVISARTSGSVVDLVEGLSLEIGSDGITALVGESGCGKSMTALAVLGLLPPNVFVRSGEILLDGERIDHLNETARRKLRGRRIAMIFQEPMSSLNPLMTVGAQIAEVFRLHFGQDRREAAERAVDMLRKVRISDPERRAGQYPHELSGGMRQRIMIAIALACSPRLLLADEPTTALDVTIQSQILELLAELMSEQRKAGAPMGVLLITHDMGVVAETAHDIVVMYAGLEAESGRVADVFTEPHHPYTKGLLEAIPRLEPAPLKPIPGTVPKPGRRPNHCSFASRCAYAFDECWKAPVPLLEHRIGSRTVRARCLLESLK